MCHYTVALKCLPLLLLEKSVAVFMRLALLNLNTSDLDIRGKGDYFSPPDE